MSQTPPPTIAPTPAPVQRGDRTTFANRLDAFILWLTGAATSFANLATNVYNNAIDAYNNAVAAASSASAAANSVTSANAASSAAQSSANATMWSSATSYTQGQCAISPITFLSYRRKSAGSSSTDPSADPTNWVSLNATFGHSTRTSNTILGAADKGALIEITSGTFAQTFTAAATLGAGWSVYLRNTGTGAITLTPSGSDVIDGMTSYVMYPNECRLIQCDGTTFTSVVLQACKLSSQVSGTWAKPPGYSYFDVLLAGGAGGGGGGGGGGAGSPNTTVNNGTGAQGGAGGGAGGHGVVCSARFASSRLPASVAYTVGSGGNAGTGGTGGASQASGGNGQNSGTSGTAGSAGGTSTFGTSSNTYYMSAAGGVGGGLGSYGPAGYASSSGTITGGTSSSATSLTAAVVSGVLSYPNPANGAGGSVVYLSAGTVAGSNGGNGGLSQGSYYGLAQPVSNGGTGSTVTGNWGSSAVAVAPNKAATAQGGAGGGGGGGSAGCGTIANAGVGGGGNGAAGQAGGDGIIEIMGIL